MHRSSRAVVCFVLALAPAIPAQGRTYIVDATMAAGAHFRDLPPAVAAATDGDRIVVRSGDYSAFVLSRGVAVIGQAGARIPGATIRGLPRGRRALLANLESTQRILVQKTAGLVQLEGLRCSSAFDGMIALVDATQVYIDKCRALSFLAYSSRATVTKCDFVCSRYQRTAVTLQDSDVALAGCNALSGNAYFTPNPGIVMSGGNHLVITDDGASRIGCNPSRAFRIPAIRGLATDFVVIDPRVVLQPTAGAPYIDRRIRGVVRSLPFLLAVGAAPGGTVSVTLKGQAGQPYFLAIGAPGPAILVPQLFGEVWLDLATAVLVWHGWLGTTGAVTHFARVPLDPTMRGRTYVWQGLVGAVLTNPSSYTHGY